MKSTKSLLAITALLCVFLSCFAYAAYAQSGSDNITLVYHNGTEKTYPLNEMHSALKGTVVLLRDSCMDDADGCDMTLVYNAIDFAVMNGAVKAKVPLTEAQYNTVGSVWLKNDFFEQLYPTVNQDSFRVEPASDGRYLISFGFNSFTGTQDENIAKKIMTARDKALKIVVGMPKSCNTEYKKAEYLYNYMTVHVKYSEAELAGDGYYTSGNDICLLYDALIGNETVCAGYAYAFAYLCELAGIDAQYVTTWTGSDHNASHEVVIAEVDGKNCWFDPTWDYGNNRSGFEYFGLSDQQFEKKHTYNKTYYSRSIYPICSSSLENPAGYWDFGTNTYRSLDAGISAGRYSISTALDSSKVLEVDGFSTANDANIQIYDNGFIDFQKFDVSIDSGGYIFKNCGSSLVMDVQNAVAASGTNVMQYQSNSGKNQRWAILDAGGGYYYIKSNLGDFYLEVAGSSTANCTNVQIASFTGNNNQKWKFTLAGAAANGNSSSGEAKHTEMSAGRYSITTALDSSKVLEVDGFSTANDANIQIYDNDFINFQKFDVSTDSGGYIFKNCGSSLVMDVQNAVAASGTNVMQYQSNSGKNQRWSILDAGGGYYYIKSNLGDFYLEVAGSSTANCTNVQIASFTGNNNQKWKFSKVS